MAPAPDPNHVLRRLSWPRQSAPPESEPLLSREWLATNGLGGYASGSLAGVPTRRYHGLLIAALPSPLGRVMMLNHLAEQIRLPSGELARVGGAERADGTLELHGANELAEFRLEAGLPVWRFELDGGLVLEKRVFLPHMQNTVHVSYRLVAGEGVVRLKLRPAVHFRGHDASVSAEHATPYRLSAVEDRYELASNATGGAALPPLKFKLYGERTAFTLEGRALPELFYRVERSRGYDALGGLWSPGYFRADLHLGAEVTLVASTEGWETVCALKPHEALRAEHERRARLLEVANPTARADLGAELVLASDQFLITPSGRVEDAARARAAGDEVRSVIAGYHWFTDWGRDTMISLEGLGLDTGRHFEAAYILRTFGHYVRDGLLPNMFPEGERTGLYHTADATLWYFHAIARYVAATGDHGTLERLMPVLRDIVAHHVKGTRFGIGVDPRDGLLTQGAQGYQLTWMDAKVDDWVVTPRRGKAVEINALWFNALTLLAGWERQFGGADSAQARELEARAAQARKSFNERFWYAQGGYLYDVVDAEGGGNDAACRPNQLFAISLDHPVLDESRWAAVLEVARVKLLTPVGLRSLSPDHPDYKPRYDGDLRARDAAYHQGTVWAWLIGPYVDAYLRVHPGDSVGARALLEGFRAHMLEACVGSISEIFDAEPPFTPRGCVAQAWSVAEVLRCWVKTTA